MNISRLASVFLLATGMSAAAGAQFAPDTVSVFTSDKDYLCTTVGKKFIVNVQKASMEVTQEEEAQISIDIPAECADDLAWQFAGAGGDYVIFDFNGPKDANLDIPVIAKSYPGLTQTREVLKVDHLNLEQFGQILDASGLALRMR